MQPNGDSCTYDHRNGIVSVGDLPGAVEKCNKEQPDEAAGERGGNYLGRDDRRTSRAFMRIGQMPLTAGTGGHLYQGYRSKATIAQLPTLNDQVRLSSSG